MSKAPHERYKPKLFLGSSHAWALERLGDLPRTSRILDIGSGSGIVGQELRRAGFEDLAAIEIDAAAREHVRPVYRRIESDLDSFGDEHFDAILLLDVLEHIAAPEAFLDTVARRVAPGGRIYISVPNVAHWSVRFPLLFGFFEYTDRGILDRTHLQLFTRRRLTRMIERHPSLRTLDFSGTISPAQFVLPPWATENPLFEACSRVRLFVAQTLPGIAAYQHLACVEVVSESPRESADSTVQK
jgi:2-polyprenyl-3-methyl-5-hydroxy-6-metoxy-1,4-benzoquinol methylase